MTVPLWRLNDVTLAGRAQPRLSHLSLTFRTGVTAILGPSGAGKTSLLNLLVGFETPTRGTIDPPETSSSLQAPPLPCFWGPADFGLWPHCTVYEHLASVRPASSAQRLEDWLEAFSLTSLAQAYPATLSQGERSRLCVARAVASEAAVLVLDEPLAHLNAQLLTDGWRALRDWQQQHGRSLIFTTHQPEVALREADRCVVLDRGEMLADGPPQTIYRYPESSTIAALCGAGTWLTRDEWSRWLSEPPPQFDRNSTSSTPDLRGVSTDHGWCVRPEQLRVIADPESPLIVRQSAFVGTREELSLQHQDCDNEEKTFSHVPPGPTFQVGDRVGLKWLPLLLAFCLCGIWGCRENAAGPPLTAVREHYWTMPPDELRIPAPRAVAAVPDGTLFVLDNVGRVLTFDSEGKLLRTWWMPDYVVGRAEHILETRSGELVIADTHYHRVVICNRQGEVLRKFGEYGEGPGQFIYPVATAEDDRGRLYVCEYGGHDRIQIFQPDGTYVGEFGEFGSGPGQFQRPSGIVWHDHRLYIVDAFNNRIHVCREDGTPVDLPQGAFTAALHYPYEIAHAPDGSLFVVEYGSARVTQFSAEGKLLGRYGRIGNRTGELFTPWGLSVDTRGRLLIADTGNRRMVQVTLAGGDR